MTEIQHAVPSNGQRMDILRSLFSYLLLTIVFLPSLSLPLFLSLHPLDTSLLLLPSETTSQLLSCYVCIIVDISWDVRVSSSSYLSPLLTQPFGGVGIGLFLPSPIQVLTSFSALNCHFFHRCLTLHLFSSSWDLLLHHPVHRPKMLLIPHTSWAVDTLLSHYSHFFSVPTSYRT